jgi:hypothetical protein
VPRQKCSIDTNSYSLVKRGSLLEECALAGRNKARNQVHRVGRKDRRAGNGQELTADNTDNSDRRNDQRLTAEGTVKGTKGK